MQITFVFVISYYKYEFRFFAILTSLINMWNFLTVVLLNNKENYLKGWLDLNQQIKISKTIALTNLATTQNFLKSK